MADVLVVAIFMAYIGFNGIISNQLGKLSTQSEDVMVLATNGTSLQPGFYIFSMPRKPFEVQQNF